MQHSANKVKVSNISNKATTLMRTGTVRQSLRLLSLTISLLATSLSWRWASYSEWLVTANAQVPHQSSWTLLLSSSCLQGQG